MGEVNSYEFEPGKNSPEEQGRKFALGVRDLFSGIATSLAKLYIDFGFIDVRDPNIKQTVIRYVSAAGAAVAHSAVETRERLEFERVNREKKDMVRA